MKYVISFFAALPAHTVLLIVLNKLGINFRPMNSAGEFLVSWAMAAVIYFCYLYAINRAMQQQPLPAGS